MSGVRHLFNVRIPTRDGLSLSADVYLPSQVGRYPVIVARTPYNKNSDEAAARGDLYADQKYAFVWVDVRGRGDSDGEFLPYIHEGSDGFDTIAWAATQSWSDGSVATWGASYSAHIQWLTALEQPPALRAMVVRVCPSDPFVEMPVGVNRPMRVSWHRLVDGRVVQRLGTVDWAAVYWHLPMLSMDEVVGFSSLSWREDLLHGPGDTYWEPRRYQRRFSELNLPVLHISGWYDDEQIGTPLNFSGMRQHARTEWARREQRMLIGPWVHDVNSSRRIGEVDFGPTALIDLDGYELRWFDHYLKRIENGVSNDAPIRIFVMGSLLWRDESDWPLARTVWTDFYLASRGQANSRLGNGVLAADPPTDGWESSDVYTYDPSRPVPFITGLEHTQVGGADDYSGVELREDVLVYTSAPLVDAIEITGPVKLHLFVSSSAPDTDFMGKLVDAHPDGYCQRLCDGMIRMRYRDSNVEQFLEAGTVYEIELDLWNTSHVFGREHRIRLEVASSAFPKYDRNLNTAEPSITTTRLETAENRVWHTATHPSRLILPVIPSAQAD
jgi:putative CocE/NonD family hydrolase